MPTVKYGEPREHFLGRCVPIVMNEGTAKNPSQAVAICQSMFEQHKKGK